MPPVMPDGTSNGGAVTVVVGTEIDLTLQTIGDGSDSDPQLSGTSLSFLGQAQETWYRRKPELYLDDFSNVVIERDVTER